MGARICVKSRMNPTLSVQSGVVFEWGQGENDATVDNVGMFVGCHNVQVLPGSDGPLAVFGGARHSQSPDGSESTGGLRRLKRRQRPPGSRGGGRSRRICGWVIFLTLALSVVAARPPLVALALAPSTANDSLVVAV